MKTSVIIAVCIFALSAIGRCEDSIESAIKYYSKYGHEQTDEVVFAKLDFTGNGSKKIIITYEKAGNDNEEDWGWSVLDWKNGQWEETKCREIDGKIAQASVIAFNYKTGGFVYLDKYKHSGLLTHGKGIWSFVYLENDVMNTAYFKKASDVGMSYEDLRNLMDSHRVEVERRSLTGAPVVPQQQKPQATPDGNKWFRQ